MKVTCMLLGGLVLGGCSQPVDETATIKQVLEKESATWRAGDAPGHAACWHIQPYSRILVSTADGKVLDIPPALMVAPSPGMGQGGAAVNTNYKMHVTGNAAWVSHDEESTAKDGQKTYSYELRMLEKIDNQWKLVGQSIHLYKR
jgi:hypothetical protein